METFHRANNKNVVIKLYIKSGIWLGRCWRVWTREQKILLNFNVYSGQQCYGLMLFLNLQKTIHLPIIVFYKETDKTFHCYGLYFFSFNLRLYLATVMWVDENGDSIFFIVRKVVDDIVTLK